MVPRILSNDDGQGWLTHLATNGAGTIHDWEYAWFGASTESVEMNVRNGTFGTWHETATNIHLALMAGGLDGLGYGRALGRLIMKTASRCPPPTDLSAAIAARAAPSAHPARADLLLRHARAGLASRATDHHASPGNTLRSSPRR